MQIKRSAFSLIEVLITIGIIATIMAVSYSFMRQGLQVREHSKRISRQMRLEHNLLENISRDIQAAQWIDESPIEILAFKPDSVHPSSSRLEMLSFSKLYNAEEATSSYLNRVSYALDLMPDGEHYALYRRRRIQMVKSGDAGRWEYLYGPLRNFSLRVWDDKKEEWLDTFSSTKAKKLPTVIWIQIELPAPAGEESGETIERKIVLHDRLLFKKAQSSDEGDTSNAEKLPGN